MALAALLFAYYYFHFLDFPYSLLLYRPPAMRINHRVDLGHEADGFVEGDDDAVKISEPRFL